MAGFVVVGTPLTAVAELPLHRLLGLTVTGELGLELVDAVVEVGSLAPDDLVRVGRALEQMVDVGPPVSERPNARPLVAELDW